MRKVLGAISLGILLVATPFFPQQPSGPPAKGGASDSSGQLPVQRVVLYKNGVGYFEHVARAHGTEDLNIDFSTAQLNDVLKSLTVVDLGQGHITGIRFNSVAPLEERLRALHLGLGRAATRMQLFDALRGTRIEVKGAAGSATGKILSVEHERRPVAKGEGVADALALSLVTDSGELRTFDLDSGVTVRIADRELDEEVGRYLNLIGSARAMDVRRMTISAAGTGDREIFVSYISEVPVWKSSYRILLSGRTGVNALIQGWAIVDNTIGEDWKNVRLSLVAGAPQSFVQNISVPFYVRRPEVPLPESVTLTPQTYEAANAFTPPVTGGIGSGEGAGMGPGSGGGVGGGVFSVGGSAGMAALEGVVKDQSGAVIPSAVVTVRNEATGATQTMTADSSGHYQFTNVQPGNSALSVYSTGFQRYQLSNIYLGAGRMNEIQPTLIVGQSTQMVTVMAARPELNTESATLSNALEEQQAEAEGKRSGEQFEYDIKDKVTIGKNQSALVPIVQAHADAEKVTVWRKKGAEDYDDDELGNSDMARRALWINNSSGLTLDGGTFNVLEDDIFQGEGVLDAIRPGEKRLVSYAGDPAVRVAVKEERPEHTFRHVQITKGFMLITQQTREARAFTISNSDSQPRVVILEYPARNGWKLEENVKPVETTPTLYRFRVEVQPHQSAKLEVKESQPETSRLELRGLSTDETQALIEQKSMTPAVRKTLRQILDQKNAINALDAQAQEQQHEEESISSDQSRLRENMKALKGTAEEKALVQRYVGELNAQEDRLASLRSRFAELKSKRDQAQAQLDQMLQQISLDDSL